MARQLSLIAGKKKQVQGRAIGLAPVVCYDPWFPRSLESIKQSVHDGHPVLVRLHSAASYPLKLSECYQSDLESHAVLIVGYDDTKGSVAVIDPWDKNWGGKVGGRRWISYTSLETLIVNTSLGISMTLSPLFVSSEANFDNAGNLSIDLSVGFYTPRGTIMDRSSWAITAVCVNCILPATWGRKQLDYELKGFWVVGDIINCFIPIANCPKNSGEISLNISATIQGKRPYSFEDIISFQEDLFVNISQSEKVDEEYLCEMA